MIAPFEASKLKIRRARRHLNELENDIAAFLARKPLKIVVEAWVDAPDYLSCHAWTARIREPVPIDLSAVIGDVVHNLRTALDLLAGDLVRLNGKSPKSVYFPFAERASDFDKMIRERNIHEASPDVVDLLRAMKPYKGGNEALRAIHDMDVQDKHKALIPAVHAASIPSVQIRLGGGVNTIPQWDSLVIDDGHKMVIMPTLDNVPLGTVIPSAIKLAIAPGDIFAGHEPVPLFESLAKLTLGVVEAFETLIQRRGKT